MRTSLPFKDFAPKRFLKKRFAPMVVTVVEDDVNSFVRTCGFEFTDLLAAMGASVDPPLRITTNQLHQSNFTVFEEKLKEDMNSFSSMFLADEFEKSGNVDKNCCDFPSFVHPPIEYGPSISPWYQGFLFRILESLMYCDFEFCDLPCCVLYATTPSGNIKSADEVRDSLHVSDWMQTYLSEIPVICIIVTDGLAGDPVSVDNVSGYSHVIYTSIRSQNLAMSLDTRSLEAMFGLDLEIIRNPDLGHFIGPTDIDNVSKVISEIQQIALKEISEKEKAVSARNKSKKFLGFFKGNQKQNEVKIQGVPAKKIDLLYHAFLCMSLERYKEARKEFKLFASSLDFNQLTNTKFRALFYASLCSFVIPKRGIGDFISSMMDISKRIEQIPCYRTAVVIPLLASEVVAIFGHNQKSIDLLTVTNRQMASLWPAATRFYVQAIVNERIAELTTAARHAVLYLARAGIQYKAAHLTGHELRVLIWIMKLLPMKAWQILRQNVWLAKVIVLQHAKCTERSLHSCMDLLSLPDVCPSLQEEILTRFWHPFNSPDFCESSLSFQMKDLVEVKKIRVIGTSMPEYYGFSAKEFGCLMRVYRKWRNAANRPPSVSLEDFWGRSEHEMSDESVMRVPCNSEVKVIVGLTNRFVFSVHLDESSLNVEYEGKERSDFEVSKFTNIEIPPKTEKSKRLHFTIVPKSEGLYRITDFVKNYWGYVERASPFKGVSFIAIHDFPQMSLTCPDLSDSIFQDSRLEISMKVENTGSCSINGFRVVLDHPDLLIYNGTETAVTNKMIFVKITQTLNPGESLSIPFILKAPMEEEVTLRGFVEVSSHCVSYFLKHIQIIPAIEVSTNLYAKMNDSSDSVVHCNITSLVDSVEICGLFNAQGRKLRMLPYSENPILNTGEKLPIIAFISNPEESQEMKSWHSRTGYSLLYRVRNNSLLSQKPIQLSPISSGIQLRIDMPHQVTGHAGDVVVCSVCMAPNDPIYIEPVPFMFIDSQMTKINGCRFVGKTRVRLDSSNNYSATLKFIIIYSGIYQFVGFSVSKQPDFDVCQTVSFSQRITVNIIK